MPIFEYACDDCGTKFEKLVRRTPSSEILRCPSCGQDHLTTQYSTFSAQTGSAKAGSEPMADCGSGMCGASMCQGGMCGMNMN